MRGQGIVLSTFLPWDYCRDVHLRGRKSKNWYWGTVALGAHNWVYGAEQNWYWEGYLLPMWHVPEVEGWGLSPRADGWAGGDSCKPAWRWASCKMPVTIWTRSVCGGMCGTGMAPGAGGGGVGMAPGCVTGTSPTDGAGGAGIGSEISIYELCGRRLVEVEGVVGKCCVVDPGSILDGESVLGLWDSKLGAVRPCPFLWPAELGMPSGWWHSSKWMLKKERTWLFRT